MIFNFRRLAILSLAFGYASSSLPPENLEPRQNNCPAGQAPIVVVVETQVVEYYVLINQYFASNTVIYINGGITISVIGPKSLSTTVTATSTIYVTLSGPGSVSTAVSSALPGRITSTAAQASASSVPPFILGVHVIGTSIKARAASPLGNLPVVGYVGKQAQVVGMAGHAALFQISENQLVSDGEIVSTNFGGTNTTLAVSSVMGSITSRFYADTTFLAWSNESFNNGLAQFCIDSNKTIYATFTTNLRLTCIPVTLLLIPVDISDSTGSTTATKSTVALSSSASATTESSMATTPPFVLGASINSSKKRETKFFYVNSTGFLVSNMLAALVFRISAGQLFTDKTLITAPDDLFANPFLTSTGIISKTFGVVNGIFEWQNSVFYNGTAQYCVMNSMLLFSYFNGTLLAGCTQVNLVQIPLSEIMMNTLTDSSTTMSSVNVQMPTRPTLPAASISSSLSPGSLLSNQPTVTTTDMVSSSPETGSSKVATQLVDNSAGSSSWSSPRTSAATSKSTTISIEASRSGSWNTSSHYVPSGSSTNDQTTETHAPSSSSFQTMTLSSNFTFPASSNASSATSIISAPIESLWTTTQLDTPLRVNSTTQSASKISSASGLTFSNSTGELTWQRTTTMTTESQSTMTVTMMVTVTLTTSSQTGSGLIPNAIETSMSLVLSSSEGYIWSNTTSTSLGSPRVSVVAAPELVTNSSSNIISTSRTTTPDFETTEGASASDTTSSSFAVPTSTPASLFVEAPESLTPSASSKSFYITTTSSDLVSAETLVSTSSGLADSTTIPEPASTAISSSQQKTPVSATPIVIESEPTTAIIAPVSAATGPCAVPPALFNIQVYEVGWSLQYLVDLDLLGDDTMAFTQDAGIATEFRINSEGLLYINVTDASNQYNLLYSEQDATYAGQEPLYFSPRDTIKPAGEYYPVYASIGADCIISLDLPFNGASVTQDCGDTFYLENYAGAAGECTDLYLKALPLLDY